MVTRAEPRKGSTAANDTLWAEFVKNPILSALAKVNDRRYPASLRFLFRVANAGADPYAAAARWFALIASIASFVVTVPLITGFNVGTADMQFVENQAWIDRDRKSVV